MWHYWKGRRTLPKIRAGLEVERKSPKVDERLFRGPTERKNPKKSLARLGWHKHRWRVARRCQARLEVEARCQKVLHAPAREVQAAGEETHVAGP